MSQRTNTMKEISFLSKITRIVKEEQKEGVL